MAKYQRAFKADINVGHAQPISASISVEQMRPLRDVVIIEKLPDLKESEGGIQFVKGDEQQMMYGIVKAIGPGCVDIMGKRLNITSDIKVGDTVIYSHFANEKIHLGWTDYKAILIKDVIAVVDKP